MELLMGCGRNLEKRIALTSKGPVWDKLVTLDYNPDVRPDIVADLEKLPYPFKDNTFDEIHAYEVLEHLGAQGDWRTFFDQFTEIWRILKPGGYLMATCPGYLSAWAWGDPSHKRIITSGTLSFLSQKAYAESCGPSPMSDFRFYYKADFEPIYVDGAANTQLIFILKAIKES